MNDQELKPLPKGLLKTVAYTQLCAAIKKDFGIGLPMKSGEETTRSIEEMLWVRTPDPLMEELAGALQWISEDGHAMASMTIGSRNRLLAALQKYQQSKVKP